jgi:type I restriction enzyme S subunit
MSEWREVRLGDVLTLQRGFDLATRDRVEGPVPVVSSSGVTGWHNEAKVEPPGVVIGRYGSLGSVHWVTEPFWPLNTALWVKDFKGNDPRYVSQLLATLTLDGSSASAVPGVNRNHLHRLPACVPPLPVQRRIAAVLAAFDELIEINERRIELLENLARSLYREWFVRTPDPERDASIERVPLTDLAELIKGPVQPGRQPDVEFEHFSLPAFDDGALPVRQAGSTIKSGKTRLNGPCVLMAKLNPRIPRVWFAVPETNSAICSTEFLAWRGTAVSNSWLWALISGPELRDRLIGAAGGTSTSHQRVKPADVAGYLVRRPDPLALGRFNALAEPGLEEVVTLRHANRALARTRDLLLPRLVTGKLDISDVDLGTLLPDEAAA